MKIKYSYLDDSRAERTAVWEGKRSDALTAAIKFLKAKQCTEYESDYVYYDYATGSYWYTTEDDMLPLGAAVLAGLTHNTYSLWSATHPAH